VTLKQLTDKTRCPLENENIMGNLNKAMVTNKTRCPLENNNIGGNPNKATVTTKFDVIQHWFLLSNFLVL
jgi:hypothetical protein